VNAFDEWIQTLERRHLADLKFSEVSRALRALSSLYVERRSRLHEGVALTGAGKRAAFALFYGPLHYLLMREVAAALGVRLTPRATVVDLGCGTGAGAAGLAAGCGACPEVLGIDRSAWALAEASSTYRAFGLSCRTRRGDAVALPWPREHVFVLAAFMANEISADRRKPLLDRLMERSRAGDAILVVEPLATSAVPWWEQWRSIGVARGGRADEWRFRVRLPPVVARLDRAAGLDHSELTCRSLWIPGR
jgi:hypothetical protein